MLSAQLLSEIRSPDCTLTRTMFFSQGAPRANANAAIAASIAASLLAFSAASALRAQQTASSAQHSAARAQSAAAEPQLVALPLPEDRGLARLEQTLKQLGTTASVMTIVAHPDD